jgi:hypothetical protein
MARIVRKSGVKEVPLSEIKDDLSRYLHEAETQQIVITRHGKPAGAPIGFGSEDNWFEYRLENEPVSCVVSNRRGTACAQGVGSDWKTSTLNDRHYNRGAPNTTASIRGLSGRSE